MMGCPTNVTEWQVAHWTRLSHQRSLHERGHGKEDNNLKSRTGQVAENTTTGKYKNTLREDHEEDLNPFTKDWRKSLRTWESSYWFITDHPPPTKNKKKVRWTKEEKK